MTLDIEHLEAMLKPWGNSAIVQLRPRLNMMIITDFVSNYHDWKEHFFFVSVNDASMEVTFPSLGLDGVEKIFPIECPLVSVLMMFDLTCLFFTLQRLILFLRIWRACSSPDTYYVGSILLGHHSRFVSGSSRCCSPPFSVSAGLASQGRVGVKHGWVRPV